MQAILTGLKSFEEAEDGTLLFSFGFYDKENIFSWLLSFGPQVQLLSPPALRTELAARISKMAEAYQKESSSTHTGT